MNYNAKKEKSHPILTTFITGVFVVLAAIITAFPSDLRELLTSQQSPPHPQAEQTEAPAIVQTTAPLSAAEITTEERAYSDGVSSYFAILLGAEALLLLCACIVGLRRKRGFAAKFMFWSAMLFVIITSAILLLLAKIPPHDLWLCMHFQLLISCIFIGKIDLDIVTGSVFVGVNIPVIIVINSISTIVYLISYWNRLSIVSYLAGILG